jgi:hypothetical protein
MHEPEWILGAQDLLAVTEDYLVGGRTPVGILADLTGALLNLLEARYGALWDTERSQPPPIPSLWVSTRAPWARPREERASRAVNLPFRAQPAATCHATLGLLELIWVQVNLNVLSEDPATPQIGPAPPRVRISV